MYSYEWDKRTRGYRLTTQAGKFVAQEIRPVYAEELELLGLNANFKYDVTEQKPLMYISERNRLCLRRRSGCH